MALASLSRQDTIWANIYLEKNTITHYNDIPGNVSHAVRRIIEEAHRTQSRIHGELYINNETIRKITTIRRTKLYEMIKKGEFPAAINSGTRGDLKNPRGIWKASTLKTWMQKKAEERNK